MTRQDGLRLLEETLELPPQTLTGVETLRELAGWDSLATVMFIAMADKKLGLPLPGDRVSRCQSVDELLAVLGAPPSDRAAA
jgi:acyl carrier protein